jgi:tRNA(Ile)-lysidine synthase
MTLSLEAAIQTFEPGLPLGVGFSAGADSTALLVACAAKWPGQVVALHVNHNLQSASSAFEQQCVAVCKSLNVELRTSQTDASRQPGQSPEDAARLARYSALQTLADQQTGLGRLNNIAIAHHADDQVETFLIALSRGAGLAGLSAMPAHWTHGDVNFYRPLLQVSRPTIECWLKDMGISFLDDPTNTNPAFTRNRIRTRITPEIESAFPSFRDTVGRSAAHCASAQVLLDDLARAELHAVIRPTDGLPRIKALQNLNAVHQANVLRYWFKSHFSVIPSTAQLHELVRQIGASVNRGKAIHIKLGSGFAVRQGEVLNWYNPQLLQSKH